MTGPTRREERVDVERGVVVEEPKLIASRPLDPRDRRAIRVKVKLAVQQRATGRPWCLLENVGRGVRLDQRSDLNFQAGAVPVGQGEWGDPDGGVGA